MLYKLMGNIVNNSNHFKQVDSYVEKNKFNNIRYTSFGIAFSSSICGYLIYRYIDKMKEYLPILIFTSLSVSLATYKKMLYNKQHYQKNENLKNENLNNQKQIENNENLNKQKQLLRIMRILKQ